jgi:hypothetical protein
MLLKFTVCTVAPAFVVGLWCSRTSW